MTSRLSSLSRLVMIASLLAASSLASAQAAPDADVEARLRADMDARLRAMEAQVRALTEELARVRAAQVLSQGAPAASNVELEAKVDALVEDAEKRRASGDEGGSAIVPPLREG